MEQQHPPPYPVSWAQRKAVPCAGLCGPSPSGPHARRDSPLTSCTLTGHSWPQSPTTQVFAWASHFQFIQQNGLISLVSKDPKETGPHSLGAMLSRTPGFYLQVVSRKKKTSQTRPRGSSAVLPTPTVLGTVPAGSPGARALCPTTLPSSDRSYLSRDSSSRKVSPCGQISG